MWEPVLGGNREQASEATSLMTDPRATHYWNDEFIVGNHFRDLNFGRVAWDIYFLYGAEANWQTLPEPLIRSGVTIFAQREQLESDLTTLWEELDQ